jgi:hypothetical protein
MPDTNQQMAKSSSGSSIPNATKLYATLRYLAGGSFHDICFAWGIAKSSFLTLKKVYYGQLSKQLTNHFLLVYRLMMK